MCSGRTSGGLKKGPWDHRMEFGDLVTLTPRSMPRGSRPSPGYPFLFESAGPGVCNLRGAEFFLLGFGGFPIYSGHGRDFTGAHARV